MKNSNKQVQENPAVAQEQCDEKKCATCFENRGCIYEQYLGTAIGKLEQAYLSIRANNSIGQRA